MSAIMMLRHMGELDAANRIDVALNRVLGERKTVTKDLGGNATTNQFTDAIIAQL
jgi:isocitrate dehydrogenase (NAD+)